MAEIQGFGGGNNVLAFLSQYFGFWYFLGFCLLFLLPKIMSFFGVDSQAFSIGPIGLIVLVLVSAFSYLLGNYAIVFLKSLASETRLALKIAGGLIVLIIVGSFELFILHLGWSGYSMLLDTEKLAQGIFSLAIAVAFTAFLAIGVYKAKDEFIDKKFMNEMGLEAFLSKGLGVLGGSAKAVSSLLLAALASTIILFLLGLLGI